LIQTPQDKYIIILKNKAKTEELPNMEKIRVVCYGLGAVGTRIAKLLLAKEGIQIVGAIDIDKTKTGKDLGEILGLNKKLGVIVSDNVDSVLSKGGCNVAIHATGSYLKDVYEQIAPLAKYGVNVISTCEELSYPYQTDPETAKKLDALGVKYGVTYLGTGINPGFLMDTLVITLTGVCQKVNTIKVERVMNAATRRLPFQKKIGAGLTPIQFEQRIEARQISGHVGLQQSIGMIASALKWQLDKIQIGPVEPVIAKKPVQSPEIKVKKDEVAGLKQSAYGIMKSKNVITLDFQAYIGAEQEYDAITIDGVPPVHQKISPCVHGDLATVAVIVNSIPKVMNAPPGLVTMKDLPVPCATVEDMTRYL
jgi:4-hydroxy-tetrahydrodipicolinate reductase